MTRLSWGPISFDFEGTADKIVAFVTAGGFQLAADSRSPAATVRISTSAGMERVYERMIEGARLQARVEGPGYEKTLHVDRCAFVWRYGPERCVIRYAPAERELSIIAESSGTLESPRFLNIALMEALQFAMMMEKIPFVHAAGLSRDGKGVLIAGPSGSGKSIVSLTLALAGFELASDDSVGLLPGDGGPRMLFSPEWLGLVDGAHELFPSLSRAILDAAFPIMAFHRKMKLPRGSLGIPVATSQAPVRHVVLLEKVERPLASLSALSPIAGARSLLENLTLFDAHGFPDVSRYHAQTIFELAGTATFHSLAYSPSNLAGVPAIFDKLLSDEARDAA